MTAVRGKRPEIRPQKPILAGLFGFGIASVWAPLVFATLRRRMNALMLDWGMMDAHDPDVWCVHFNAQAGPSQPKTQSRVVVRAVRQYKSVLEYLSRAPFLGTRPNISEYHSEISTRVPFCIGPSAALFHHVLALLNAAAQA